MQTSYKAGFKQITSDSNPTSNNEFQPKIKQQASKKQRDANKLQSRRQTNNQRFKSNIKQ
jgi:hypothetical protein